MSGDKKSPKNTWVFHGVCCPQTARPCCWLRTARIPARDHRRTKLESDGSKLLVKMTARRAGARGRAKKRGVVLSRRDPLPAQKAAVTALTPVRPCRAGTEAGRFADSTRMCWLRTTPLHAKQKVFFGDFLSPDKKLPARFSRAEALKNHRIKSLRL